MQAEVDLQVASHLMTLEKCGKALEHVVVMDELVV